MGLKDAHRNFVRRGRRTRIQVRGRERSCFEHEAQSDVLHGHPLMHVRGQVHRLGHRTARTNRTLQELVVFRIVHVERRRLARGELVVDWIA